MSEYSIPWPRFEPRTTRIYTGNVQFVSDFGYWAEWDKAKKKKKEEGKEEHEVIKTEDSKEEKEEEEEI
jgi:hypothetical protein